MTEFIYSLGDLFYWLFENTLEPLGMFPNWSFLMLGFGGLFFWLKMQKDFNEKAKSEGTLK
ncbi:MAG: hypothetical protein KDD41_04470 [Flavobacteriales bacterium]|nr:hypothetical protein [Flavobacteriales bacterium]